MVPEYVAPLDEDAVQAAAFELLFAFDEVISLGYKEHVTVQQAGHAHLSRASAGAASMPDPASKSLRIHCIAQAIACRTRCQGLPAQVYLCLLLHVVLHRLVHIFVCWDLQYSTQLNRRC